MSAIVGATASLGAAALSGMFSVQETTVEKDAEALLAQQKFSFELIQNALSEADQTEQVRRLKFMAQIGLLPTVDAVELAALAEESRLFFETGGQEGAALPNYTPVAERPVGRVQLAMNAAGLCAPPLTVDSVSGPATVSCAAAFLNGDAVSAYRLLWWAPETLRLWLELGRPPVDWPEQVAALQLEDRVVPGWVAAMSRTAALTAVEPVSDDDAPRTPRALDLSPRAPLIVTD